MMRGCLRPFAWFGTPQGRLLWLAPVCCQLVTGAKAPAEFLAPGSLLVALVVHGCGALAVHELARRWADEAQGPFWPRLLWLAAAYGVLVDGVMLGSYTSLDWSRLGRLADTNHGHIMGLNLTWALIALAHHVALAVAVPVALVELRLPESRGRAWLGERGLRVCNRLFWTAVVFGLLAQEARPSKPAYVLVMLLALLLWRRARYWQPRPPREARWRLTRWLGRWVPARGPHPPWRVLIGCAALTLWLLTVVWLAPLDPPNGFKFPRVLFIFLSNLLLLRVFVGRLARRAHFGWSPRHTLAAAAGPLLAYAALAPWQALDTYHGEYPQGMGLVGLAVVVGVWRLRRTATVQSAALEPPVPELSP